MSSGISVPVGMKNPTAGSTTVMLNSILRCAGAPELHLPQLGGREATAIRSHTPLCVATSVSTVAPTPITTTSTWSAWPSAIPSTPAMPIRQRSSTATTTTRASVRWSSAAFARRCRQLPPQRVHLQAGQRLYDRVLPGGRQSAGRWRRLWQVHHRPVPGLGKDRLPSFTRSRRGLVTRVSNPRNGSTARRIGHLTFDLQRARPEGQRPFASRHLVSNAARSLSVLYLRRCLAPDAAVRDVPFLPAVWDAP